MNAQLPSRVRLGNFRSALVIEKEDALRSSIVRFLKDKAWLGHELRRAEQAFPIFARFFFMTLWSSTGARRLPKPSF
jgi:hypothetical protein